MTNDTANTTEQSIDGAACSTTGNMADNLTHSAVEPTVRPATQPVSQPVLQHPNWGDLAVVLVRPRFPENIGMVARACANLGCSRLLLVAPERWDLDKSAPLATHQGMELLRQAVICPDLPTALSGCHLAIGSTARLGGWRRGILTPEEAAREVAGTLRRKARAALVFGSEDSGLHNHELELCGHAAHISTVPEASSLNLAQAVLLMLYECSKLRRLAGEEKKPLIVTSEAGGQAGANNRAEPDKLSVSKEQPAPAGQKADTRPESRLATIQEYETLFALLKQTLLAVDYLQPDNPDWFMQPMKRFIRKARLRRHEFSMLMGVCKQVLRLTGKNSAG